MRQLVQSLVRLSLSEKEAAVYLALLKLGSATAQDVARAAGVNRVTTYAAMEELARRGLASAFERKGKRLYVAQTPEHLATSLENEKADVAGKEHVLNGVMPMLVALFNAEGPKPHVRFMEGEEGREAVRRIFLGLTGEFVQLLSYDDVLERRELHDGQDDHFKRLKAGAVRARAILSMKDPNPKRVPRLPDVDVRLVPADLIPFHGEVTVRGSMVFLYAYHPSILSVVITSKEIAGAVRALFELAWRGAETIAQ